MHAYLCCPVKTEFPLTIYMFLILFQNASSQRCFQFHVVLLLLLLSNQLHLSKHYVTVGCAQKTTPPKHFFFFSKGRGLFALTFIQFIPVHMWTVGTRRWQLRLVLLPHVTKDHMH